MKLERTEYCLRMNFENKIFRRKLRNWSHLLKKSLMENFIFCAVRAVQVFSCNHIN